MWFCVFLICSTHFGFYVLMFIPLSVFLIMLRHSQTIPVVFTFLFRRLLCLFLFGRAAEAFVLCLCSRSFFLFVFVFPLFVVHFPVLHLPPTANVFVMAFCFIDCFVYSHVFIVNSFISLWIDAAFVFDMITFLIVLYFIFMFFEYVFTQCCYCIFLRFFRTCFIY